MTKPRSRISTDIAKLISTKRPWTTYFDPMFLNLHVVTDKKKNLI